MAKTTTSPAAAPVDTPSTAPADVQTSALTTPATEDATYVRPTATVLVLEECGFGRPNDVREMPQEWAANAEGRGLLTTDPARIALAMQQGETLTEREPVIEEPAGGEA